MKTILYGVTAFAALLSATTVCAGGGLVLDFEEPETTSLRSAPNPYNGTTWSENEGRSDLILAYIPYYNENYDNNLPAISGDQVATNQGGFEHVSVDLGADYAAGSVYLSPWKGNGPSSMSIKLFNDEITVAFINVSLVEDEWTFVDLGLHTVDAMEFIHEESRSFWLMDDLVLLPTQATEFCSNSSTIHRGIETGGDFNELCASDDIYWHMQPDALAATLVAPIRVELTSITDDTQPISVEFALETAASHKGVVLSIELWNYTTEAWEGSVFPNISTEDTAYSVLKDANASDYVSDTGEMKSQISYLRPAGVPPFWNINMDSAVWLVR